MEEKTLSKQEILKEIEKVLDLYDEDIINIGYFINFTFKDYQRVEIHKNHSITNPYGYVGCGITV